MGIILRTGIPPASDSVSPPRSAARSGAISEIHTHPMGCRDNKRPFLANFCSTCHPPPKPQSMRCNASSCIPEIRDESHRFPSLLLLHHSSSFSPATHHHHPCTMDTRCNSRDMTLVPTTTTTKPPRLPVHAASHAIAKRCPLPRTASTSASVRPSSRKAVTITDPLTQLPPDISLAIIDRLRDRDVAQLPRVCKAWARIFHGRSSSSSSSLSTTSLIFRALVRERFGYPPGLDLPNHFASWGEYYLMLRHERCHICPCSVRTSSNRVAPLIYAASSFLCTDTRPSLSLFPVCKTCFHAMLNPSSAGVTNPAFTSTMVPVIEPVAIPSVFPQYCPPPPPPPPPQQADGDEKDKATAGAEARVVEEIGYLYSNWSTRIPFVHALPIAQQQQEMLESSKRQESSSCSSSYTSPTSNRNAAAATAGPLHRDTHQLVNSPAR